MESTACFTKQMSEATNKSLNLTSWILRVFRTRDKDTLMTLFRSLVLPHLENSCQMWSPHLLGDIRRLESVQRSFTNRISEVGPLSYWERLKFLNLYSLERRRERYIILYTFKIILGLVPNFTDERFKIKTQLSVRGDRVCRVPAIINCATTKTKTLVENSFAVQAPKLLNSLTAEIRIF